MKILIATDGSDFSKKAIRTVCEDFTGKVEAFRIVSVFEAFAPMAAEPFAVSAEYYQQLEKAAKEQAEGFAKEATAELSKAFPNAEISTEIVMGSPNRVIVDNATEWGADMIVVGSHGRGFWGRVMLGSVSDAVLHHAPCSVMVVR